ncbi:hypothetical protein PV08_01922 [Exophiala spinifera]|uniref:Histone H4 n=1 Tax=Exophiala spinifera TaxID=91928 RepID=A0A0D2A981_9EURO|nr:uncharacterized protein PV08_01922 [Exophiala spinifera]KIW21342.1 hypothetical protein PV08_01922 [Exophiala spinifera]
MPVQKPVFIQGQGQNQGLRRHRPNVRKADAIHGITKPSIRRLARRGGVRRIQSTIYDDARMALKDHLTEVIRKVVILMGGPDNERKHGVPVTQKKTVTTNHVIYALKQMGRPLYGFHEPYPTSKRGTLALRKI